MLYKLLADMEAWKANLPENLKFRGPESPQSAGKYALHSPRRPELTPVFLRLRHSAPAIHVGLHDLLACIYADQLLVSRASQIWPHGGAVELVGSTHGRVHRLAGRARTRV